MANTQSKWCEDARNLLNKRLDQVVKNGENLDELAALASKSPDRQEAIRKRTAALVGRMGKGKPLGSGAFGQVFRLEGREGSKQKPLAFKELTKASADMEEKMNREADIYAKIGPHPNVVGCYGVVEVDGKKGIAMQLAEGGELENAFDDLKAKLDAGLITRHDFDGVLAYLTRGVLRGLQAMQDAGLVHHDIKPENVMIDRETLQPMLVDMGIAAPTGKEANTGTAGYLDLGASDSKKDVYSVGAMLFKSKEGERRTIGARRKLEEYDPTAEEMGSGKRGVPKRKAGFIAKGGAGLAYPDFLDNMMTREGVKSLYNEEEDTIGDTYTGRLGISEALEHRFLKDSALSDERAQEVLKELISGRKGRRRRQEKLLKRINELNPQSKKDDESEKNGKLERNAKALQKRMEEHSKAVVAACSKSYSQAEERNKAFSELKKSLTHDRSDLDKIEKETKTIRPLIRQLAGEGASGAEENQETLELIEKAAATSRYLLEHCAKMLEARLKGSWNESYGADSEQLCQQIAEANETANTALWELDSIAETAEKLLKKVKDLIMDPAAAIDCAQERIECEKRLAFIAEDKTLQSPGDTLETVQKRAQVDVRLRAGKNKDVDQLEESVLRIRTFLQRAKSALQETEIALSRRYSAEPDQVWKNSAKWFLDEAVNNLRRRWLYCVKETKFELRESPGGQAPMIAKAGVEAAARLQAGGMDVATASDAIKEVQKIHTRAQERIPILAEAGKAVKEAIKVFELYADFVDNPRELQNELKGIDGRLGSPKDIRRILQASVDQWSKKWMGVLNDCKKALGSRAARDANAVQRKSETFAEAEQQKAKKSRKEWTKEIKQFRSDAKSLLKKANKKSLNESEKGELKKDLEQLQQKAVGYRRKQRKLEILAADLQRLSSLPKSDPALSKADRKTCSRQARCLSKLVLFFPAAEQVLIEIEAKL